MGEPSAPFRKQRQAVAWYGLFLTVMAAAVVGTHVFGEDRPGLVAAAAFAGVVAAAMVISWGAEAAQFFISQGFAVALIALLQVLPEFMVEAVIAWKGEIRNMFANATGSNRLLIGLGWPLIYFTADVSHRLRHGRGVGDLRLRRENILEIVSLVIASSWYLKLLATGELTLFDGGLLAAMYVAYMIVLSRLPGEDDEQKEDLLTPPRALVELRPGRRRTTVLLGLFLAGGGVMVLVAHPFVEALKHVAVSIGVREFVFIQWMAPFLSEFPEKVTAFYWSRTIRLAPMALLNMISSTVSQFTLLVGMIPIVYAISYATGHLEGMQVTKGLADLPIVPMATEHHDLRPEVFLSWAMTIYGCSLLAKLRFTITDATSLFLLWLAQFVTGPAVHQVLGAGATEAAMHALEVRIHVGIGVVCVVLAALHLARHWKDLEVRHSLRETWSLVARRGAG